MRQRLAVDLQGGQRESGGLRWPGGEARIGALGLGPAGLLVEMLERRWLVKDRRPISTLC